MPFMIKWPSGKYGDRHFTRIILFIGIFFINSHIFLDWAHYRLPQSIPVRRESPTLPTTAPSSCRNYARRYFKKRTCFPRTPPRYHSCMQHHETIILLQVLHPVLISRSQQFFWVNPLGSKESNHFQGTVPNWRLIMEPQHGKFILLCQNTEKKCGLRHT